MNWEENKQDEIKSLTSKGILPVGMQDENERPHLMGAVSAVCNDILPAKQIVDEMVMEAAAIIRQNNQYLAKL